MTRLRLQNVEKSYDAISVIKGIDLTIDSGVHHFDFNHAAA